MMMLLCAVRAAAQAVAVPTQIEYPVAPTLFSPNELYLDTKSAAPRSPAGLGEVIHATLGAAFATTLNLGDPNTYVIVHLVRWNDPAVPVGSTTPQQTVQFSRWYVYSQQSDWGPDDLEKNNRIFGAVHVWLFAVHLNIYVPGGVSVPARVNAYHPVYTVKSVRKTAAPLQHFAELGKLFPNLPGGGGGPGAAPQTISIWGGQQITIDNPADVTITPTLAPDDSGKAVPVGDEAKFDNEGRYWWDVGIAVPIRSAKDLSADAATGTFAPKTVTKSNAFATIDVFFKSVDVKRPGLRRVPHVVGGVTITDKPLNAFIVGLGWGPAIANFYGGWLRLKLENPAAAGHKYDDQFTFGVELPIANTLIEKLSK